MKKRWILEEKIFQPLGQNCKFLHLIRAAMIGLDNLVDEKGYSPRYFLRVIKLTRGAWNKKAPKIQNKYEKQLVSAVFILREFFDAGFYQAKKVYEDFLKGYRSDYKWALNRNKILSSKTIKELNTNIGTEAATIFLYLQMPKMNFKDFKVANNTAKVIVQKYGLVIKSADNLASLYEDIFEGFITIPKENINKLSGLIIKKDKVIKMDKKKLKIDKNYILKLVKETKSVYKEANQLLDQSRRMLGLNKEQAGLLKKWAYTWLEDVKIKTILETT